MTLQDIINQAASEKIGGHQITAKIMQDAVRELADDIKKNATTNCKFLIQQFAALLSNEVDRLKMVRKHEKELAERVKKLDNTFRYFAETGNPFPMFKLTNSDGAKQFCKVLGIEVPESEIEAWEIPSDWKPTK